MSTSRIKGWDSKAWLLRLVIPLLILATLILGGYLASPAKTGPHAANAAVAATPQTTDSESRQAAGSDTAAPNQGSLANAALPVSSLPQVVIIGDSLSTGFQTSLADAWPTLLAPQLASLATPLSLVSAAENGAGYITAGSEGHTFGDEVTTTVTAQTQTVVFFGSDNDLGQDPALIESAAAQAISKTVSTSPTARIVVVGPPSYSVPADAGLTAIRDALKAAAQKENVQFVDPIADDWIASKVSTLIGPDGEHPSVAGHQALAVHFRNIILNNGS